MVKDLILELLQDLNMSENSIAEEEGHITVPLDENITVTFNALEPTGLRMFTTIGSCPKNDLETLFTKLMTGNLFGEQTNSAVIGLDCEGKNLSLSLELPFQSNYTEFYGYVESFLNDVDYWQNELNKSCKDTTSSSSELLH